MPRKKLDKPQGPTVMWFLDILEQYLTLNEMENDGETLGWLSVRDATMIQRLRDGGDVTITKMDDALSFMQRQVNHYLTSARTGTRATKTLKPLIIKPRSYDYD